MIKHSWRLRIRVLIPAQDYNIDWSKVEILCRYSNSRGQVTCVAYDMINSEYSHISEPAQELHSRAAPSVSVSLGSMCLCVWAKCHFSNHREKSRREAEKNTTVCRTLLLPYKRSLILVLGTTLLYHNFWTYLKLVLFRPIADEKFKKLSNKFLKPSD